MSNALMALIPCYCCVCCLHYNHLSVQFTNICSECMFRTFVLLICEL
ncbi:hypothetical protein FYJ66_05465 [Clostridiales Family XIII bacterium RF-744-FAT-WT-3]|uniref:Uncharacterized protein n=1 Tax=Baileyella intestinalis TaxID=2606709 RepID=A0A6A8MA33_9FIRM|nr:hypothetical protein [Baileyella intestinalis]